MSKKVCGRAIQATVGFRACRIATIRARKNRRRPAKQQIEVLGGGEDRVDAIAVRAPEVLATEAVHRASTH
jgi:hypothetical protein